MKKDKIIKIKGIRGEDFKIIKRWSWTKTLIEQTFCDKCKDSIRITFHDRDILKLIKSLQKLNMKVFQTIKEKSIEFNYI